MTKKEIVKAIHQKLNIPQKDAAHILEVVISVLKESLADKQTIKIVGFGTFAVRKRGKRKGRNLTTGDEVIIKPQWAVSFHPSQMLKDAVNGKEA
jgi:integration host factor subunit alpha